MENEKNKKLWGGRFTGNASRLLWKYNASINLDKRLWEEGKARFIQTSEKNILKT